MKCLGTEADDNANAKEQLVNLKVYIPDLLIQKSYQFHKDEIIYFINQIIIDSLPKELKESFNYGIFCPPVNGKAGKFLDEQRPLADYPFHNSAGYVEFRYKRRVYKMSHIEEKQIKQMHTRSNLRRMLDHVTNGQVEKITKMCSRGMDPNFHCIDSGETPLALSTLLKQPARVIMALINGGALLDFRTKDGLTALHKAVERNNLDALKTLLDLGASPNYKDNKGLTPLYYTLLHSSDHQLTEVLLHDHAFIGTCDPQGWQEVHQACKHGLIQHLENLLFYGANRNARNASGNTPLHVCAVNDQESCARVLLFRGADKNALNYANQSPYQVAVIAGNLNLGELIRNHNEEDTVPYREMPRYNPRRRASIAPTPTLCRTISDPRMDLNFGMKPPSPCPSNCSLPPFSSISCISDISTGSSTCTQPSGEESADTTSGSIVTGKSARSDSSGVCTISSATGYDSGSEFNLYHSGPICLLVSDYCSSIPGHLKLCSGDIVEVIGESDDGLLLGKLDTGQIGLFPQTCIQENYGVDTLQLANFLRIEGRCKKSVKQSSTIPKLWKSFGEPRTVILHKGKKGFGFVLRGTKASSPLMGRELSISWPSQYLEDVNKGGVADLSGLKKGDYLLEINGQDVSQASHEHVVSIIQQSGNFVAMTVSTMQNFQFVAEVENLPPLQYRQFATLPRKCRGKQAPAPPKRDPKTTLSVGRVKAHSMIAGLAEIEYLDRSLKEYDSEDRLTKNSSVESISNKVAIINNSDPHLTKTASIKARPSSQRVSAAELEQFFARQGSKRQIQSNPLKKANVTAHHPKVYGSVAQMKRSKALRLKPSEVAVKVHKEFFSTPDLKDTYDDEISCGYNKTDNIKCSISHEELYNIQKNRHSWACSPSGYNSYPGLYNNIEFSMNYNIAWKSIEDVYNSSDSVNPNVYIQTLPFKHRNQSLRASCPPPSHPPPPPPPLENLINADISKAITEFLSDSNTEEEPDSAVMSSFRPGDSAKLYASPEVVISVGYKDDNVSDIKENTTPKDVSGGSINHSKNLLPKLTHNKSDKRSVTSTDAENSDDSGGLYSTFKKNNKQRNSMSTDSGHASDRKTLRLVKGKPTITSIYHPNSDSDTESPRNSVIMPKNEPFIPEPDYESSEDEYIPTSVDKAGSLSTFGRAEQFNENAIKLIGYSDEVIQTGFSEPNSPHTEAKKAIQEARERLRFSQKPLDKNATVVFISGKITEHKIEKSEIQLHRTEEGRLTGTVVISTTNENEDPTYISSSILKTYENDQYNCTRYPSRDAPASEYAKYRKQILEGVNQPSYVVQGIVPTPEELQNAVLKNIKVLKMDSSKNFDNTDIDHSHIKDCQKEVLTNANSFTSDTKEGLYVKSHPDKSLLQPKEICTDDLAENSSSGVSSDIETQSDQVCVFSSSTEEDSKAETVIHLLESSSESKLPEDKSSDLNESKLNSILTFDSRKNLPTNYKLARDSSSAYLNVSELPVLFPQKKESLVTIPFIRELPITCPQIRESPITYSQGESKVKSIREKEMFLSTETQTLKPLSSKHRSSWEKMLQNDYSSTSKSVQMKDRRHHSPLTKIKHVSYTDKSKSSTERSLEESLEVLRLQVSSLGLGAGNEVDVFTELVPPPPQFAASVSANSKKENFQSSELAIAPPPEFSDYSPRVRNRSSHRPQSNVHQRKNYPQSYHLNPSSNIIDLNLLATLRGKSPNLMPIGHGDRKSYLSSNNRGINAHLPYSNTCRHFPSGYEHSNLHETSRNELSSQLKSVQKEFRAKDLKKWNSNDISDWLDSLFLPEYKQRFYEAGITGAKLANMDSNDLMGLGVKQMGHRLNMETSLKRYLK